MARELKDLVRTALSDGAQGVTFKAGERPVIHTAKGWHSVDDVLPDETEVWELLRQVMSSRDVRRLREGEPVYFQHKFENSIGILVGAKLLNHNLQVELRRLR